MAANIALVGLVIFIAHFLVLIFQKTRIPDVLLLMVGGIVVGPILHQVTPEHFGRVGPIVTTIALIVILFESGVNLELKTLVSALGQTLLITTVTWLFTAAVATLIMLKFTPIGLPMAMMTGTILGGTSSAVVIPMIDGLKMTTRPRTVLFLESAITDVLCIVGAVGMLAAVKGQGLDVQVISLGILKSFGVALVIGVLAGFFWSLIMGEVRRFPNTIFTTVAYVFVIYGVTELLGFSGAIAALSFGVALSNLGGLKLGVGHHSVELKTVNEADKLFFAESVFLLKTFFFIYLGLSLRFDSIIYALLALGIVIPVYLGRAGIVRLCASRKYEKRDAALMTTMVPKGLAAAVLATLPVQHQLPHAEWVPGTVYMVVLISICLTALLVILIEKTPVQRLYFGLFGSFAEPVPEPVPSAPNEQGVEVDHRAHEEQRVDPIEEPPVPGDQRP